jgi:DNA-binding Lrp family transcriptional regulator
MDVRVEFKGQQQKPVDAYILIRAEKGSTQAVIEEIDPLPGVSRADAVTGAYNAVVRAEAPSVDGLAKVVHEIQAIPGVTGTLTCFVIDI